MKVLAIGAHFDDIELGCGGTLAKHIEEGDEVYMLVITDSEYADYNGAVLRSKQVALKEGKRAAEILGVENDNLMCWGYKTKKVKYNVELIERINKIIDRLNIDTVYTHWIHDIHQDHSAIGRATLNAARHVPRILMYRSNWYTTDIPFRKSFFVDISSFIDQKIKALWAHRTEYKNQGEDWINFVKHQSRNSGIEMETEYAEAFEIIRYLR